MSLQTFPAVLGFRLAGVSPAVSGPFIGGVLAAGRYVQPHLLNYIDAANQSQSQAQNALNVIKQQILTDVVNWYVEN